MRSFVKGFKQGFEQEDPFVQKDGVVGHESCLFSGRMAALVIAMIAAYGRYALFGG